MSNTECLTFSDEAEEFGRSTSENEPADGVISGVYNPTRSDKSEANGPNDPEYKNCSEVKSS